MLLAPYLETSYLITKSEKIAYKFDSVDYQKLKLFFISLLWRASASEHDCFSDVKLGPFQDVAGEMIMTNDPGDPDVFSVVLSRFQHPTAVVMLNPDLMRFDDVKFYRFYLAAYVVIIKVDKRDIPAAFKGLELAPNRSLIVLLRDFTSSKELPVLKKLAAINQKPGRTKAL